MNNHDYSPFTPGSPVPVALFVGRARQISEVVQYVRQTLSGKQENIFLSGDRGIGKSSLISFIRYFVSSKEDILGIHVFLGGVESLDELMRRIFAQLLKETQTQKWFNKIKHLFGTYIEKVDLFGISLNFSPPAQYLIKLSSNFSEAVFNLIDKIKNEKKALFIALDDINGLAEKEEFANWYKSFVDEVATKYKYFPVSILLIGLPEKRDRLSTLQPSLMRIFRVVEIEKLIDIEVDEFLRTAFRQASKEIEPKALDTMVRYSSGLPLLMQEIGDATYWTDSDGVIGESDAYEGIMVAAERIGRKYLDPKIYHTIRSSAYRSILRKMGKSFSRNFTKSELELKLNEKEKKVFHNFLKRLRELGIIETDFERGRGAYKFINELYPVYIGMESEAFSRKLR